MKVPDQDDLAWDLLDVVRTGIDATTMHRVSITLVNRDYPTVLELLLTAAVESGAAMTIDVRTRLDEWARFYPVHPEAERLHELIAMVRGHHGAAVHAQ
ncbi:hypothetical protein [Mycolicibacterium sediminis]|uniref:Uncharacterized protein n=1 Tax=Mycolicibacterium sediminis TaxID=1286180 RepID=A0A7I7QM73_9MYCO|nr:hypothetical protein [Mycolicibacterium sediminis]BBY27097.1 hypothetical protein MSEDJ_11930 [Mycolicibacterium sediminis]